MDLMPTPLNCLILPILMVMVWMNILMSLIRIAMSPIKELGSIIPRELKEQVVSVRIPSVHVIVRTHATMMNLKRMSLKTMTRNRGEIGSPHLCTTNHLRFSSQWWDLSILP